MLDTNKSCIEHFCSAEPQGAQTGHYSEDRCGEVVLTITHIDEVSAQHGIEDCVTHLNDILDERIAAKDTLGGTFLAVDALYETCVVSKGRRGF